MAGSAGPVLVVCLFIIALWYVGSVFLNAPFAREKLELAGTPYTTFGLIDATLNEARPVLPSPHQVAAELWESTLSVHPDEGESLLAALADKLTSKRSLTYHAWITLEPTLLGFLMGTLLGIGLALAIVHSRTLDNSLMPWIIASQTIPVIAIAPMVIVVGYNVLTGYGGLSPDGSRLVSKALISTFLSFFPVTVGMVKGLRSPDPIHLDLMRTYNASAWQVLWKLRWPASLPFLFVSMKVAVAASLVGTIVGELPTGAVAGLGARLLTGSYYGQTVQIWAALIIASLMAAILVWLVGVAHVRVLRRMGAVP